MISPQLSNDVSIAGLLQKVEDNFHNVSGTNGESDEISGNDLDRSTRACFYDSARNCPGGDL